jgi:hypothetical protein
VKEKFEAYARELAEQTVANKKDFADALEKVEDKLKDIKKGTQPSTEERLASALETLSVTNNQQ